MSNAQTPAPPDAPARSGGSGGHALLVAAGIFLSRIAGLVRQRAVAHYFGSSAAADAFAVAIRIPNFLQNLFGEGVLSASFIPVYAGLLARDDREAARRVAGAVAGLLGLVTSLLVLAGVLAAPLLVDVIAPGLDDERRGLTVTLVRILFPGTGLLVLSAWCLGVLNSHHRFFMSYAAPVLWNAAIVVALVSFGGRVEQFPLAEIAALGSVVGSALQLAVQLPTVLRLLGGLRPTIDLASEHVRAVVRNFVPVFISRGVVQISAFVDEFLGSLLPTSALSALAYAQTLYILPVSLFGMSVSAAELPAMSSALGSDEEIAGQLRARLDAGLRRIAFFVVPSAAAFLALGDVVAGALFQSGRFTRDDSVYVWAILAGATVGLLPSTFGRLYSSTFYALRDTRTPLRFAILRVGLATAAGYALAVYGPALVGAEARWGVVGITLASGLSAWLEFALLRRALNGRIGRTGLPAPFLAKLWATAAAATAAAWGVKLAVGIVHPVLLAALTLAPYGLVYFGGTWAFGIDEARTTIARVLRLARRVRR
jgi:putative peptidoglycan lipid II flippase